MDSRNLAPLRGWDFDTIPSTGLRPWLIWSDLSSADNPISHFLFFVLLKKLFRSHAIFPIQERRTESGIGAD